MTQAAHAMVMTEFKQPLQWREFPMPRVSEGEVLVRITAAGVCGSDVHMWSGEDPRTPRPIILGHEGAGEIADIGGRKATPDGEDLKAGDKVLWNRGVVCGKCYWCAKKNDPSLCPNRWVYGIHNSCDSPPHLNGCYAEYVLLDRRTDVFKIDTDDLGVYVPASCSGATAAHAVDLCPVSAGDTVVVQGPGPLGLFLIAFAADAGAGQIVVIGGTPERLAMCENMGATHSLNRRETTTEERRGGIMDLTDGRGADVVYEAVGTAAAVEEGVGLVRNGGAYALTGFGQPGGAVTLDCFADIVRKNLRVQGVWVSHTRHTKQSIDLVTRHVEKFRKVITHRFPLREANEALKTMLEKSAVKIVLEP
ncbi:MAG: alcohol dehydrogenase catalytic domain-containing protein [Planctomycetes bacterium]|nr:alcohol dehydrogenase catalytic domain-containing protein [Planctomycetota bacterium]